MGWTFALLGLVMVAAGGGAIYMGWPLLPLERGWTLTISGAFCASSGAVCLALAGVIAETRRMRRALERGLAASGDEVARATPAPAPAAPEAASVEVAGPAAHEGRSITMGDTTFVVFDDGTIEARTPKGVRRYASMQELRDQLRSQAAVPMR
jgi:hypothetical protein